MLSLARFSALSFVLAGLLLWSTDVFAQGRPVYAKVHSAKIALNPTAALRQLEEIARETGSIELLTFPADGNPCEPTTRELLRLGDPFFAYPGFSVRIQEHLAEERAAGNVADSDGGKTASTSIEIAGNRIDIVRTFPESADAPVTISYTASGKEIIRVTFHPLPGAAAPLARPRLIRVTGLDGGADIIQVFDYFDTRPAVESEKGELAVPPRLPQRVPVERTESKASDFEPLGSEISLERAVCDPVNFGNPTRGRAANYDSGWLPGGNQCAFALQGRITADAGIGIEGHAEGEFCLDPATRQLCVGSGSGYKKMDIGLEFSVEASVCVALPLLPPLDLEFTVFDLDLGVFDREDESSFLIGKCVEASDTAGIDRCVGIDVGVVSGEACINVGLEGRCRMCGESINISDGHRFTRQGECRTVNIACNGYHETATYTEEATWTAAAIFVPCVEVCAFEVFCWDWCPLPLTFDIISGLKPDLAFSSSGLDFNVNSCGNGLCDCGETCNSCPQDCACSSCTHCQGGSCVDDCGNGTCQANCGENCDTCSQDCACSSCTHCQGGSCVDDCGNGTCQANCGENCNTCSQDCACPSCTHCQGGSCVDDCGNGTCQANCGENCNTCSQDCACLSCTHCEGGSCVDDCGNGTCQANCGENCNTCSQDCACPSCTHCQGGSCVDDCGNGTCQANCGENCNTCSDDCGCGPCDQCVGGTCVGNCGNGSCESACSEDCNNCAQDCACPSCQQCVNGSCTTTCGNGTCEPSCAEDCGSCATDCGCGPCDQCVGGTCVGNCGNEVCEPACSENCNNCAEDCACAPGQECVNGECTSDGCPNGTCDGGEDCDTCPSDCACASCERCVSGSCEDMCGNGTCEPTCSETRSTCPDDCACTDDSDCNDNLCEECDNGDCRSECDADAICVNAVCVSDPCAGIVCDNGNLCDGIEVCQNGSCEDGTPIDCEDNDPCTIDTCDANLGCRHTPIDCPPGAPGFTPDPGCGACGNGAGMGMVISLFGWLGLRLTGSRRRAGKCAAKSAVRASKATEYVSHD